MTWTWTWGKRLSEAGFPEGLSSLGTALLAAPWGADGAWFITDRGLGPGINHSRRVRELTRNSRPVARVTYWAWPQEVIEVCVFSSQEGERTFQERRALRRGVEAARQAAIRTAREAVLIDDELPGWEFRDGQCGGVYRRRTDGVTVSAPGLERWAEDLPSAKALYWERRFDRRLYGT